MDGTPEASTEWSSDWGKFGAFNKSTEYWCGKEETFPATVWMQLPKGHRLAMISFKSYYAGTIYFEVIGSHDCVDWTTLLNTETIFTDQNEQYNFYSTQTKKFHIPSSASSIEKFSCIGLRIPRKPENAPKTYACVGSIQMWE